MPSEQRTTKRGQDATPLHLYASPYIIYTDQYIYSCYSLSDSYTAVFTQAGGVAGATPTLRVLHMHHTLHFAKKHL